MHALVVTFVMIAYALILNGADYVPKASKALSKYARVIRLEEQETPEETQKTVFEIWNHIAEGADPSPILEKTPILLFYAIKINDGSLLRAAASSPNSKPFIVCAQETVTGSCIRYALRFKRYELALDLVLLGLPKHVALAEVLGHLKGLESLLYRKDEKTVINLKAFLVTDLIRQGADPNYEQKDSRFFPPLCNIHPCGGFGEWQRFKPIEIELSTELVRLGAASRVSPINCDFLRNFYDLSDNKKALNDCVRSNNIIQLESRLKSIIFAGENDLHAAIRLQDEEILAALLNDFSQRNLLKDAFMTPPEGVISPLRLARNTRLKSLERQLISYGADPSLDVDIVHMILRIWQDREFWMPIQNIGIFPREIWQNIFFLLLHIDFNEQWGWRD